MNLEIHTKTGSQPLNVELPSDESWRVILGSSKWADVQVRGRSVLAEHAAFTGRIGKIFIEPIGNAPIKIEGRAIKFPTRLRLNQDIEIGNIRCSLQDLLSSQRQPNVASLIRPAHGADDLTLVRRPEQSIDGATSQLPLVPIIQLDGQQVIIGRTIDGPGRIEDPQVSRAHATIRRQGTKWVIRDAGSTNGTFVNGEPAIRWRELTADDVVAFGSLLFVFDGTVLKRMDNQDGVRVEVLELTKTVRHRDTGEPLHLIDGISVSVHPGEFVVMLGSSGCGKSTFMDAINGRRRATSGRVLFNGRDLYEEFPSLKRAIGYVPQQVIYHKALSVGDILLHSAHIRLPTDTSPEEIEERILVVLDQVDLIERRRTPAEALSGGQQKRVSIAIELLSRPKILFLDEVTSGLDMKTEREMMELFRQLADDGITIFCITHHLESLDTCHHVAYFFKGKLAFFGPEQEFQRHFEIEHNSQVYGREEGADPKAWEQSYQRSPIGLKLHRDRLAKVRQQTPTGGKSSGGRSVAAEHRRLSAERAGVQTASLTRRYIKLLLADRATLAVTLSLAPVIGMVMAFAADSWSEAGGFQALSVSVMAIATVFFFGLFTSSREIVRDLPVYLHERMVGLEIVPYLMSRIGPLCIIGLFQVVVFVGILRMFTQFEHVGAWWTIVPVLYATSLAGSMLGLLISAMVERVDTAVSLMIFVVVPQLLFAGNLGELVHPQKGVAATLVSSYWAYDAAEELLEIPNPQEEAQQNPELADSGAASPIGIPHQPNGTGGGHWWLQIGVILAQAMVFLFGAYLLVLRRDGPGAIRRFFAGAGRVVQERNKDDLLILSGWVSGASKGLRKR
jgi:ABC-type multidrug transport system ATPase subunit